MQAIWVLAVVALASADVSHLGYHYKVPTTSYGVPSHQIGSGSSLHHHAQPLSVSSGPAIYKGAEGQYLGSSFSHGDQGVPSHLSGDAQLSASSLNGGIVSGLPNGASSGSGSGLNGGLNSVFGSGSGLSSGPSYYQTVGGPSTVQPIYLGGSNQYHSTHYQSGEKYQQYYQVQSNEPAQVYKHFYVHSAPEELEAPKPRTPIVVPPPQKHYKIIFVKTPNPASHSSAVVPVQQQKEEKTIVYVLVKKPEEQSEVIVPKVEDKPPSKPEVYFIKYNNKEDSQAVINNIVNDYNKPGQSVSVSGGASEGSPVLTGLPSSGSGLVSGGLSDVPSYPSVPSGGFGNVFTKYPTTLNIPSSSSFSTVPSSIGSTFAVPSSGVGSTFSTLPSVGSSFSGVPSSFSTGPTYTYPTGTLFNHFGSPSVTVSGVPSGSSSGVGSGSGFSGGSGSGSDSGVSGSSLSGSTSGPGLSSVFGSSQSDSSIPAPVVSSSVSSESTPDTNDSNSDSGAEPSSVFSGVSSPSVIPSAQDGYNTISGSQGLPHETYGVPKFRIA